MKEMHRKDKKKLKNLLPLQNILISRQIATDVEENLANLEKPCVEESVVFTFSYIRQMET